MSFRPHSRWWQRSELVRLLPGILLLFSGCFGLVYFGSKLLQAANKPTASTVLAPDGFTATLIECQQAGDCLRLAATTCPRGYEALANGGVTGHWMDQHGTTYPTFSGALMIRCLKDVR